MSRCWHEGELRAWFDRELPEADGAVLEQHLSECAACAGAMAMVRARAERVGLLMGSLAEMAESRPVAVMPAAPANTPGRIWLWSGLAAAVAAGLALAFLLAPGRHPHPAPVAAQRAVVTAPLARAPAVLPPKPVAQTTLATPPGRAAKAAARDAGEYYMALDDEPIETGVVMRVALEGNLQADVIFDSQGRPRAIRPVR